jgi:hypothetical protein
MAQLEINLAYRNSIIDNESLGGGSIGWRPLRRQQQQRRKRLPQPSVAVLKVRKMKSFV